MANLGTFTLKPSVEYQNLASVTGVTFTSGQSYQLQIRGDCMLCEDSISPEQTGFEGFRIINDTWTFICRGNPIWFKNYTQTQDVIINIAE